MSKRSRRAAAAAKPTAVNKRELHRSRRDEARLRQLMIIFGSILGVALVILAAGLIQQYYLKPRAPLAVVNGTRITASDYRDRTLFEKFRVEQRFGPLGQTGALAQQIQQYLSTQLPNQVFETMITDEVLRQEAVAQNISITDADINKAIEAEYNYYPNGTPTPTQGPPTETPLPTPTVGAGTPVPTVGPTSTPAIITEEEYKSDYNQFLSDLKVATGLGESYYRDTKRAELLYDRFREQAIAAANIPATTLQVRARQIQLDTEEDAKKVLDRLKAGEDFAAVAKEVSKDTVTKDQGGDLGWFSQGTKDPIIEKAAFSQTVNALSDPLKVGTAFYILQVTDAPTQRPISDTDRQQKEQAAFDNFLSNLQSRATIERDFRNDAIPSELTNPVAAAPVSIPTSIQVITTATPAATAAR